MASESLAGTIRIRYALPHRCEMIGTVESAILPSKSGLVTKRTGRPTTYSDAKGQITNPELKKFAGLPLGGFKYRMHQLSSAVGRVQLKYYKERMEEIQAAMNYFWDLLEDVPGVKAHRPPLGSNSTMGGWYAAHGIYVPEELDCLDIGKFCAAVRAEGAGASPGANLLLHLHPVFNEADVYGHGKPTRIANSDRDVRQPRGSLPVTESIPARTYSIAWFKHYRPRVIEEYALAFRKVAENAEELMGQ